jgi:peptidoglycan/LPS O-acetylase OafA/YrhL
MSSKLGYVEGMRGVAALIVCVFHFTMIFLPAISAMGARDWGIGEHAFAASPINVILNGNFAVCLFFVLSGYVLSCRFMADGNRAQIGRAAAKRYPRLMLPALASALLGWLMIVTGSDYINQLFSRSDAQSFIQDGNHRRLIYAIWQGCYGAFFGGDDSLNPALWTIRVETLGSALVFFLLVLTGRSRWRWYAYAYAAALSLGGYYFAFPIGILIAALTIDSPVRPWLSMALAVTGLYLGGYPYYGVADGFWGWLPVVGRTNPVILYHTIGAAFLLPAVIMSPFRSVFDLPVFYFLGRISYSLYLIHCAILASLTCWLVLRLEPVLGYFPSIGVAFAVTMPFTLLASYIFTLLVDEPSTRLADWFARWAVSLRLPGFGWARSVRRVLPGRKRIGMLRVPTKPAMHSEVMPAARLRESQV